ncbi:DNA-binding protein [Psychrobacillus sp. FSL K6-1415]|uniref:DNA-binding protein n=1 Tax=Psychrobacillus sp. FSL K6-1415 TaxID=2921544 RepID=UPI0030F79399
MLNVQFDAEALREIIREEVREAIKDTVKTQQLPPMLTIQELMGVLHIGRSKAFELMARDDFPVCREAGVLIPTDKLFKWIDYHTQWVESNTKYFSSVI